MKHNIQRTKQEVSKKAGLSVCLSLILVAAAIGAVFGIKKYLQNKEYNGPILESGIESTDESEERKEYLDRDGGFRPCYVMGHSVSSKGVWANKVPGKKDDDSISLSNGQILRAKERGVWEGETYYLLADGTYLNAGIAHVEPLRSYTRLEGYLAVTYISSSGVKLRSWADFKADNVVKSVYVGDKVQIQAKVETEKGASAYLTSEGLYITTDTRYFNDYTVVPEDGKAAEKEEKTAEKEERTSAPK